MNLEVSSWILVKCLQHHLPIWINLSCTNYSPIIQGSSCMIQTLLALSILCAGLPRNKGKNILPTLLDKIKTMCLLFQCNWKKKKERRRKTKRPIPTSDEIYYILLWEPLVPEWFGLSSLFQVFRDAMIQHVRKWYFAARYYKVDLKRL